MYLCLSYVSCCCWSWFLSVCICSLCAFSPIIFCLFAYVAQASFVLLLTHWSHVILYLHLKEKLRNQIWSYALLKPTTFELHSLSPKALINIYFYFHAFFSLHLRWVFFFFPLTDSERAACNISGKYFSNNQTLVSICSVLLVVLQSLIWQHAALIWLSLHTTTKALNTWAPVS